MRGIYFPLIFLLVLAEIFTAQKTIGLRVIITEQYFPPNKLKTLSFRPFITIVNFPKLTF